MGIGDLALGLRWSGLVLVDLLVRFLVHDTLLWNPDNAAANTMVPEALLVSAGGFVRASISLLLRICRVATASVMTKAVAVLCIRSTKPTGVRKVRADA